MPPVLALAGAALALACRDERWRAFEVEPPVELERLAFVPAGRTPRDAALDVGVEVDLLVDRYEVTRHQWLAALRQDEGPWGADGLGSLPATHVTLEEAAACARARGMRLPTVDEWLWCAVGPRAAAYPYSRPQEALANTSDLGLGRPAPVGTFENGQTPDTGVFDLHGNVRELAILGDPTPGAAPEDDVAAPTVFAMGGSFDAPPAPTFSRFGRDGGAAGASPFVLADRITGLARLPDVGLRCVAPAREWLRDHGARLSREEWRPALRAVGARWGPRAAPLLAELAAAPDAPRAFGWLLEGAR